MRTEPAYHDEQEVVEAFWALQGFDRDKEEATQYANLFVAAPELLRQLKMLVQWAKAQGADCQSAKEVIAKAEGRMS